MSAAVEFPIYLFIFLVFVNRYAFGMYLRFVAKGRFDRKVSGYEPVVEVIVPMYNEGPSIAKTIEAFAALDYPPDKLTVTIIDDCSTDGSYEHAVRAARRHPCVSVYRNPSNVGKRIGIAHAVRRSRAEIIVSVDSDVLVDRRAVRELVARFSAPDIAAVGGRVHVSNANDNWLSRMQTIKYHFGQEWLKNVERYAQSVMCLSGCLTAYRRRVLLELEPILEHRNVLGVPIKYGEDRFLTRQIVKAGYRTVMTLDAQCFTKAPTKLGGYFKQQLRWKRSNIVDIAGSLSHAWRLHPLVGVHFLSLGLLLFVYPFVVAYHVVDGSFASLIFLHLLVLALLGVIYRLAPSTRALPPHLRVHPVWFLPMAVLMPAAYLILTPLALFTLDSSSWETRAPAPAPSGGAK